MIISKRNYKEILFGIGIIIFTLLAMMLYVIGLEWKLPLADHLSKVCALLAFGFGLLLVHTVEQFMDSDYLLIKSVERNLERIGAYSNAKKTAVYLLPEVSSDEKGIHIKLDDMEIRRKIEQCIEIISTALPPYYICSEHFLSSDESELTLVVDNLKEDTRITYESPEQFVEDIQSKTESLILDKKRCIDLRACPHLLITGKTGQGKSYYASTVAMTGVLAGWDVTILDYKRSYSMFKNHCKVAFSIEDIYDELRRCVDDMHRRQTAMEKVMETDFTAIASDYGFPVKLIVIEEYMALVNSGADKKILKDIENMLLEITAVGRALSVHLVLVMQVSSATTLNSSIRANLNPLVFGQATNTIYETAFNTKSVPKVQVRFEKGEGLGMIDGTIFRFKAPTFNFDTYQLLQP